ncbi:hypothetical protein [Jatrophihabitans endophyticus]|uniref:hypothetical protein n=1 Tax=Jatrophihabitans endophyticus TaxID=1206085 RepID=UPI0019F5F12F|nr:hypothetical protein [Jatrophihabitans endophyticus]MBE7187595.1 hypothetical protein [Jatrophihabitans endophyticus]
MTAYGPPDSPGAPGPGQDRQDNGLRAATYVPLTDVDAGVGRALLTALGRARIAAYLAPGEPGTTDEQRRLYVASDERVDARTIVAAAVRALDGALDGAPAGTDDGADDPGAGRVPGSDDPLNGLDTDAVFESMVADWHVDTHTAIRAAERDLTREDADWRARLVQPPLEDPIWLDDDHFVPPAPPPLPRLHGRTVLAIVLLAVSIMLLGWGVTIGLPGNLGFVLGILGILASGGILLSRLHDTIRDEDDDGSAV